MMIGVSGLASSGKSAFADFLAQDHGFVVVGLADPLKRICREIFDFSEEQLWGPSEKRNEPDPRYPRENVGVRLAREVAASLVADNLPLPEAVRDWSAKDPTEYLTPRHALQSLGTDWGRNCYSDVWVDYAVRTAKELLTRGVLVHPTYTAQRGLEHVRASGQPLPSGVVIPDVRFRNELEGVRAAGGIVVRIRRIGAGLTGVAASHASETEQAEIPDTAFDHVLENDGSLEDLRAKAREFVALVRP